MYTHMYVYIYIIRKYMDLDSGTKWIPGIHENGFYDMYVYMYIYRERYRYRER